jgi:hypothetical protein
MPDFAPNVTARYRLHYKVVGRNHTVQCRGTRGIDVSTLMADGAAYLRAVFSALAAGMADDLAFISAEYALTDSDLFFPATLPAAVTGLVAASTFSKQDSITHLTFSGRGAGGSKVSQKIYGVNWAPDVLPAGIESDFVVTGGESAIVLNAIAAFNNSPSGRIVAIDNTVATYHGQATLKINDFWLRKVRQGL